MLHNRKIIVILPAYNAEKTLQKTVGEIPFHIVDTVILTEGGDSNNFYLQVGSVLTSAISMTSQVTEPSAMKIVDPMLTLWGRLL